MTLRDGKFYEGDKVVPIEFGNKEQIRLMNEAKEYIEGLNGNGIELDIEVETTFTVKTDFKCLCGQTVWFEIELDYEDDYKDLDGECTSCPKCRKRYELSYDSGETLVKLVK